MITKIFSPKIIGSIAFAGIAISLMYYSLQAQPGESLKKVSSTNDNEKHKLVFGEMKIIPASYLSTWKTHKAIQLTPDIPNVVTIKDYRGQFVEQRVESVSVPMNLDGEEIFGNEPFYAHPYREGSFHQATLKTTNGDFEKFLYTQLLPELTKLSDGQYHIYINDLVIDKTGKIAYYSSVGVQSYDSQKTHSEELKVIEELVKTKINDIMNSRIEFNPATASLNPCASRYALNQYQVVIKNHQVNITERAGC